MEEVTTNARFNPDDYLGPLSTMLRRKAKDTAQTKESEKVYDAARRKLEEVRLALARNLARALVAGFDTPF